MISTSKYSKLKKLMNLKPSVYGVFYLLLIPLYALIFTYYLPDSGLYSNNHNSGFLSNLYFSVITITTLGYGDISPVGKTAQFLTASESLLGIILIGLFLNSLSHQHGIEIQENEKRTQQKRDEKQAIERFSAFNQLIELNITRYKTYSIPVTTPISERNGEIRINEDFSFNDMSDLFEGTLMLTDHHFTPAVEYYFKSLKELVNSLEELVKLGYVHRWPEIESLCIGFMETSKKLDFSAFILNQPNIRYADKKGSEVDAEMIKEHKGEVKTLPSTVINAYVALFQLIHESYAFIRNYKMMASEIIEKKDDE